MGTVLLDPVTWDVATVAHLFAAQTGDLPTAARGRRCAVAADLPATAFAGRQALRAGGTAADALVAMAALDTVLARGTTSLAGELVAVYHDAGTGDTHVLDAGFNTVLGDAEPYDPERDGATGRAVLVPGLLAGLEALWRRFGVLPWADLWAPARHFAREGFPLSPYFGRALARRRDVLLRTPEGRMAFAPAGALPVAGEVFRQPALARTLEQVAADGAAALYRGDWSARFAAAVGGMGGRLVAADLARYEARWVAPLTGTYLGHEVRVAPPFTMGGLQLLAALDVAEALDLHRRPPRGESARVLYEEIRAEDFAREQSAAAFRDPAHALSKAAAAAEAARIRAAGGPAAGAAPAHQTEKVGAVDGAGNVAVASHSLSGGSWGETGLFVDGVVLNSRGMQGGRPRPEGCRPGDRWHSYMCPYIVLRPDGGLRFAAAVDGTSLVGCNLQATVNVLAHGLDLAAAAAAPRWGSRLGVTAGGRLTGIRYVEGFDPAVLDEVERLGQPLSRADDPRYAYGNNAGFWLAVGPVDAGGEWLAVSDPRLAGPGFAVAD